MIDHTFAVPGLSSGGAQYMRGVADAVFAIPGVHAVGIDRTTATLTVTSSRPIGAAELGAAIDETPCTSGVAAATADLATAWVAERDAARDARDRGDPAAEWWHLERAHILSQPKAGLHVRTHVAMLAAGLRRHDRREIVGQLMRLLVAGPGSLTGRYPVGNTGGADVNALTPMPIPADLLPYLSPATHTEDQP